MAITALPTPPSRQDPANFAARGDAFMAALPMFVTEANALQSDVNAKQQAAAQSQIASAVSQVAAAASQSAAGVSANLAAASAGAALWVSGTSYAVGSVVYSAVTGRSYRRLVAGAGTTDPSADTTNWRPLLLDIDTGYPTILPGLNLDFANSKTLDPRITFSRASTATYYDGRTVAKAEENLLVSSQEFSNTYWSYQLGTSYTLNNQIAPDGSVTADTITFTGTSSSDAVYQNTPVVAANGVIYMASVWLRAAVPMTLNLIVERAGPYDTVVQSCNVTTAWTRFILTHTGVFTGATAVRFKLSTPSVTGDVYVWGAQLEQRSQATAYTPTTSAPITNYIPVLQTAVAGVPRFNHDPITSESKGLLIEEARANLLTYSDQFDNAAWGKTGSSISANCMASPDGAISADKLVEDSTNGMHKFASPSLTPVAGTAYTASIYAKAAGRGFMLLELYGGGQDSAANINLSTGEISVIVGSGVFSAISAGNGFWRISCTATAQTTGYMQVIVYAATGPSTYSYQGDGYSGIYIWGAQLEVGAFPTSYIPTTTAQVTRAADSASMTGVNFSSWYRSGEGSFYAEYQYPTASAARYVLSGGDISNQRWIYGNAGSSNMQIYDGSTAAVIGSSNQTTYNKAAVFSAYGVIGGSLNGSAVVSQSTNYYLARDTNLLIIGDGNNKLNGCIKSIRYYPKRLSNSELQALTA